jgi:hypothetical protein
MGITALTLAVPGAALAHNGHGRHHHHHHRARSHAHHAKFRLIHVGPATSTPAPAPATTPTPENAGTVTSYTNGVLTLTLKDGSTVSGKVTNETRIRCVKATPQTTTPVPGTGDRDQGEDNGQGDDRGRGDMGRHGDHGSGDWRGGDDGDGPTVGPEPPCDSSALVTGAVVRTAELRIGPGGTEFECVLLVR